MKQIISILSISAIALMALSSCQKENEMLQEKPSAKTAIMTVNAGSTTTKTAINEVDSKNYTLTWTAGDAIACYEVGVVKSVPTIQDKTTSTALDADAANATFTINLSGNTADPNYSYIFVYPAAKYTKSTTTYRGQIPEAQTFSATSFDKDADLLISRAITNQAERPTSVNAEFERIGATALMNIKAPNTTEKIRSITFSTTEGNLWGYVKVYPVEGTHDTDIYSGGKSLTLTPASPTTYSGTVPVWFRLGEITLTDNFKVVVTTNQKIYTKTVNLASASRTLEFHNAGLTKFNVNMESVAGVDNPSLDGDYLIGSYYSGKWHLMSSNVNSSNYYERYESPVTKDFGSVAASDFIAAGINTNDYCWKVEEDATNGYSIKSYKTGKYVSLTVNDNKATAADALDDENFSTYFTFSVDDDITTITSTRFSTRYLRFNSQNPRFAFYASNGSNISLIPCDYDNRTAVTLSFAESSLSYDTSNFGTCSGQVAAADPNVTAITNNITYALTGDNIGSVDASTGAVTLNGAQGSATITASFAGDGNYLPAQNSYTITVSGAGSATLQYSLIPAATGGNSTPHNNYTAEATITISEIGWAVTGNSSLVPWRIGGKSISGVDRAIYSTTAIPANISQIVITHGAASSITVNSMKVYVCSTAAGAAANTPTNVVASFTPSFVANDSVTINKADETSWAGCYYRIVYNVTVSGDKNKFLEFSQADFYGFN